MNSDFLFNARKSKGLTQLQVADAAGIKPNTYCNIENGKRRPSVATAKRIAKILGISWSTFFE